MSGGTIFQLILLALVFIAWAWLLFRTISLLQARGGIGAEFGEWWRSPDDRKDRNTLRTIKERMYGETIRLLQNTPGTQPS